jgi:hypothetical protein
MTPTTHLDIYRIYRNTHARQVPREKLEAQRAQHEEWLRARPPRRLSFGDAAAGLFPTAALPPLAAQTNPGGEPSNVSNTRVLEMMLNEINRRDQEHVEQADVQLSLPGMTDAELTRFYAQREQLKQIQQDEAFARGFLPANQASSNDAEYIENPNTVEDARAHMTMNERFDDDIPFSSGDIDSSTGNIPRGRAPRSDPVQEQASILLDKIEKNKQAEEEKYEGERFDDDVPFSYNDSSYMEISHKDGADSNHAQQLDHSHDKQIIDGIDPKSLTLRGLGGKADCDMDDVLTHQLKSDEEMAREMQAQWNAEEQEQRNRQFAERLNRQELRRTGNTARDPQATTGVPAPASSTVRNDESPPCHSDCDAQAQGEREEVFTFNEDAPNK